MVHQMAHSKVVGGSAKAILPVPKYDQRVLTVGDADPLQIRIFDVLKDRHIIRRVVDPGDEVDGLAARLLINEGEVLSNRKIPVADKGEVGLAWSATVTSLTSRAEKQDEGEKRESHDRRAYSH